MPKPPPPAAARPPFSSAYTKVKWRSSFWTWRTTTTANAPQPCNHSIYMTVSYFLFSWISGPSRLISISHRISEVIFHILSLTELEQSSNNKSVSPLRELWMMSAQSMTEYIKCCIDQFNCGCRCRCTEQPSVLLKVQGTWHSPYIEWSFTLVQDLVLAL